MRDLVAWKSSPRRKPLLIRGARQVGKTWLARRFGEQEFASCLNVNFDEGPGVRTRSPLRDIFDGDLTPGRIVRALESLYSVKVDPAGTLLFFDEVQAVPRALTSLKYFAEEAPEYAVVAAGSHLGVTLHPGTSFPVGKVDFLYLHPLTFSEFVAATGRRDLAEAVATGDWALMDGLHALLVDLLREYLVVGGMPEVVDAYLAERSPGVARRLQESILTFFRADFSKHAPPTQLARIWQVWDSIPVHLGRENQKLVWGVVRPGGRAKDFEFALQWLADYGVVHKVPRLTKPGIPLATYAEDDVFKMFGLDVGLLGAMAGLSASALTLGDAAFTEFRGTLAEQFVLQHLVAGHGLGTGPAAYYWTGKAAEVDFVVQRGADIVPLEVKSATHVRSQSLRSYVERYEPRQAYRLSLQRHQPQAGFTNVPLYAVESVASSLR